VTSDRQIHFPPKLVHILVANPVHTHIDLRRKKFSQVVTIYYSRIVSDKLVAEVGFLGARDTLHCHHGSWLFI